MGTPSHITMLREISAAGDRERTGALDVEWDGAHVTLFFMFGHPSHVVFETADGRNLVGEPALDAFVTELPTEFRVAPWRRAMVTDDTLHCTAEDLMGLFQRRNAAVESNGHEAEPPAPVDAPPTEAFAPTAALPAVPPAPPASTEQPPFGLSDFPLLPLATTLWTDAAANVINLEGALSRLPDCLIVLAGPTCQGAALVAGGRVTDAVWVNATGGQLGDEAAHALMNSLEGSLTAYRVDDPRIMSALPLLWRAPRLGSGLPGGWLHTEDVVAEVRTSGRSCCLVVDSADPGVALFEAGDLVAVYTVGHRWPATSMAALRGLLHEADARVIVLGGHVAQPSAPEPVGAAPDAANAESEDVATDASVAEASGPATETEVTLEVATDAEPTLGSAVAAEAGAGPEAEPATESEDATESTTDDSAATDGAAEVAAETSADDAAIIEAPLEGTRPKGRGRKGKGRADIDAVDATSSDSGAAEVATDEDTAVEPGVIDDGASSEGAAVPAEQPTGEAIGDGAEQEDAASAVAVAGADDSATPTEPDAEPVAVAEDDFQFEPAPRVAVDVPFEPAVFTIADLATERTSSEPDSDTSGMAGVEAREATEFVPARLDIDVDALRTELTDIATVWLGEDDAAPVAQAIGAARPGVDDFVSTIRAIGAMEIPGHESAVVRAMAREMHFRASEVLCGV